MKFIICLSCFYYYKCCVDEKKVIIIYDNTNNINKEKYISKIKKGAQEINVIIYNKKKFERIFCYYRYLKTTDRLSEIDH